MAALAAALTLSVVVTRESTTTPAAAPVSVNTALVAATPPAQIDDAVVINRPSNGLQGTALALANGKPMFPLAGDGVLSYDIDLPFAAVGVKVQQAANDTGFWIGDSTTQRAFVHVTPDEVTNKLPNGIASPTNLGVGQVVDVTGYFKLTPADPSAFGVSGDGLLQLHNQTEYIEANSIHIP